jgi:RluA family pseudouridine synthase
MKPAPIKLSFLATREFWEMPVLFEDEHLLALDKPTGLLTSPDRLEPERPNLMTLLHAGIAAGKAWAADRGLGYLANAFRLDFETSGVLLLAKSKPVLVKLVQQLGSEKPCHRFLALAQGTPREPRFEIHAKLGARPAAQGFVRVDPKRGKRSRTQVEVAERFRGYALLHCEPLTHRRHQVRAHLRLTGLPVVGDTLYGGRPLFLSRLKQNYRLKEGDTERPLMARVALHSERLALPHPVTGEPLLIASPWPKDLTVAAKYLRRFALAL